MFLISNNTSPYCLPWQIYDKKI